MRRIRLTLSAGLLATGTVGGAWAAFTDSESVGSNTFSTGTLDITASPATALFNATNMSPGTVVHAALTVTNSGSLPLTYSLASAATDPDSKNLKGSLTAEARVVSSTCSASTFDASATVAAPPVTGLDSFVTGSGRSLAASGSEVLCFRVTLPSSAGNALQGATTVATFTLSAV